jgi:hypothetical protein
MNQDSCLPHHPPVDNLSFPLMLARLFGGGDIVQFVPCSLDLLNEIGDGVSTLYLEGPAFTPAIEDSGLTLHLFHILSCTHTFVPLMETVQVTLQLN